MFSRIQEVFRQVDIFGQSITLSFRQQEKYRTSIGGFLSLSMIAIVISFFYSNIISFFDMTSVTSSEALTFKNDPEQIILDPLSYMFAVQIEQNDFINNPYFNITLEQRHYERFDNGTQYRYPYQYIDLVQCTLEHFKPIFDKYNVTFEDQYNTLNLSNFLCPNLSLTQNLTISGSWKSKNYYFLKFSVGICVNNSNSSLSWKPTCKSADDVTQAISQQGSFRFQLYQVNYLINPDNPNTFAEPYLSTETFYSFVPKTMFVQSDIFLRSKTVNTDRGILMYPDISEETFPFREFGDERQQISLNSLSQTNYGAFYLNASPYKYSIKREYMRLDELLSYLGGFSQFMIVIVGIFASLYNREHLKIQMANDLYEFDMNVKKSSPLQQPISQLNRRSIRNAESIGQMPDNCQNIEKMNLQTNNHLITDEENYQKKIMNTNQTVNNERQAISIKQLFSTYFEDFKQYVQQKYRVKIGVRMFLSTILPFDCIRTDDSVVVEKALNQVKKELDIEYIIKKVHEIQKLKKILFNNEQIILFNFTQKPIIALYQDSQMRRRTKIITYEQDNSIATKDIALLKQFTDLVQSYQFALREIRDDQFNYNSRLLHLLGTELQNILEKEIKMQNQQCLITEAKEQEQF